MSDVKFYMSKNNEEREFFPMFKFVLLFKIGGERRVGELRCSRVQAEQVKRKGVKEHKECSLEGSEERVSRKVFGQKVVRVW